MRRVLPLAVAAGLSAATIAQSPPMEDVIWADDARQLVAVDRTGRIVRTVPIAVGSGIHRAPDGTLWGLGGGSLFRLDPQGGVLRQIPLGGTPRTLAIDGSGNIWLAMLLQRILRRYAPDGTLQTYLNLLAPVLEVSIGADGTVWVAMDNQPSSLIALVDPASGSVRNFTLPPTFGRVRCMTTTPWGTALIGADQNGRILEVDTQQRVRREIDTGRQSVWGIAPRPQGDALAVAFGALLRIDLAAGRVIPLHEPVGSDVVYEVALDARGGIWLALHDRIERFDPVMRRRDSARVAQGSLYYPKIRNASGHHRALVLAPSADDDGDGTANAVELGYGTNPYDAQSNGAASVSTARVLYRQNDALAFEVAGVGGQGVALLATDTLAGQPPLPGFVGSFRLDPARTLPVAYPTVLPGAVRFTVPDDPSLDGRYVFAQAVVGLFPPRLSDVAGVLLEQPGDVVITEAFDNALQFDADRSSGSWANGVATPGPIGGIGSLGDFDHTHGQDLGNGVWLWSTDDQVIPATATLDGVARRITDGRFEFGRFHVPVGIRVRFRGSHPAVIRVNGLCTIDGTLDLAADLVPGTHDGKNYVVSGTTVTPGPGQAGGMAGAGGGRGGDGAWSCDGSGNPSQPQFHDFAGYDGEDVQVPASHAYAANAAGTGGRGSVLFPSHGDDRQLVFGGLGNNYAVESAAGGGGGGFRAAGGDGICTFAGSITGFPPSPNTTDAHRGPPAQGGVAFRLFPVPVLVSSLDHFLVGGSGGGGGGSHPVFSLATGTSDPAKYRSGGAGAGGGGAVALRVGGDLSVGAAAQVVAQGGSCAPSATTISQGTRGVPAPGGGGSGGSVLLQVGGAVAQNGMIDVRGGSGSPVVFTGFFNLDTRGGDGAHGSLRLEVPQPNPPLSLLGRTFPAPGPNDVDTLRDRDFYVGQLSALYGVPSTARLVHYELDVRVGGAVQTFTDDPARFRPANQPGQPVRIRFQGKRPDGSLGPWRDLVAGQSPGAPGIAVDLPTDFRFQLIFDSTLGTSAVVEELRVVAR